MARITSPFTNTGKFDVHLLHLATPYSEGEEDPFLVEHVAGEDPEPGTPQVHSQQLRMRS